VKEHYQVSNHFSHSGISSSNTVRVLVIMPIQANITFPYPQDMTNYLSVLAVSSAGLFLLEKQCCLFLVIICHGNGKMTLYLPEQIIVLSCS
jgi:hypothetical protein